MPYYCGAHCSNAHQSKRQFCEREIMAKPNKPTTLQQLTAMNAKLDKLELGIVQLMAGNPTANDSGTATLLLYSAVAHYGMAIPGEPGGVVATLQVPLRQIEPSLSMTYQGLDNGTVLVRLVRNQENDGSLAEPADPEAPPPLEAPIEEDEFMVPSEEVERDSEGMVLA